MKLEILLVRRNITLEAWVEANKKLLAKGQNPGVEINDQMMEKIQNILNNKKIPSGVSSIIERVPEPNVEVPPELQEVQMVEPEAKMDKPKPKHNSRAQNTTNEKQ